MSPAEKKFKPLFDAEKWAKRFEKGVASHEEKHRLIYEELVNILGPRYVTDDRGVSEAYSREMQSPSIVCKGRAEFIVLPSSTEDVRQIVQLANRLNFPFSVQSCGLTPDCWAPEGMPYWCQLDMKRMDRLVIDERNMCATVEPYVTHAQVQVEAMKVGLYNGIPSSGGQSSCLANHICFGFQSLGHRTGFAAKNLLAAEMVLPNGDILKAGSLAAPAAGCFWGEGPGADARALVRGLLGHYGSLGIVTKIGVKLFPWPGPPVWPVEGTAPNTHVNLPEDKFRWYFVTYRTMAETIDVMREISKAEIAAVLHRWDVWQYANFSNKTREEHWKQWDERYWEKTLGGYDQIVLVGLWGWASEKQVKYEEKVLNDIVGRTGGKWLPDELYSRAVESVGVDSIRTDAAVRTYRLGMGWGLPMVEVESLPYVLDGTRYQREVGIKYMPPMLDTGFPAWVAPWDFGHFALLEAYGKNAERTEEAELELLPAQREMMGRLVQDRRMSNAVVHAPLNVTGPPFANVHRIAAAIKKALDPNFVANPARYIDMVAMEESK